MRPTVVRVLSFSSSYVPGSKAVEVGTVVVPDDQDRPADDG
jgi:hypothetical protein